MAPHPRNGCACLSDSGPPFSAAAPSRHALCSIPPPNPPQSSQLEFPPLTSHPVQVPAGDFSPWLGPHLAQSQSFPNTRSLWNLKSSEFFQPEVPPWACGPGQPHSHLLLYSRFPKAIYIILKRVNTDPLCKTRDLDTSLHCCPAGEHVKPRACTVSFIFIWISLEIRLSVGT